LKARELEGLKARELEGLKAPLSPFCPLKEAGDFPAFFVCWLTTPEWLKVERAAKVRYKV